MKCSRLISILFIALSAASAWAQSATGAEEYYFLNVQATGTLEKELNQNAAQGWRLLLLPKANNSDTMGALLKKPGAEAPRYEYKVLAAQRIGTLENEFKAAIAEGYDFRGVMTTERVLVGNETLIVLERLAGQKTAKLEYIFLNTKKESTLQKETEAAVSQGYVPSGFVRTMDNSVKQKMFGIMAGLPIELTMILARNRETPAASMGREYKTLATSRLKTLEKEMNEAAQQGYRFYYAAPAALTIMVREPGVKAPRVEYQVLGTNRVNTMEKEMNDLSKQGFRYMATSNGAGGLATIFERTPTAEGSATPFEIKLVTKFTDTSVNKEIQKLVQDGYQLMDITNLSNFLLMLQKSGTR
ncbi:MAG: hypothetical protein HOP19_07395 [Acidobacteria bacterium]|nr:hypothetical protein [Acidobacteriota bacterium]